MPSKAFFRILSSSARWNAPPFRAARSGGGWWLPPVPSRPVLEERISTLRRQRLRHDSDQLVVDSGDDLVLEWEQRGLASRRAVLEAVVDRVEVTPSAQRVGRKVAHRTTIRWRTEQRRNPAQDDGI